MVDVSVLDVRLHGTKIGTITHIQDSISVLKFVSCGQSGKRRRGRGGGDYQIILSGSSSESFLSAEIKGAW